MKKTAAVLCFLLLIFSGYSQRTIRGKVVNAQGGQPVAGGSVFISGTSVGTVSNQAGVFELNNVPAGRHELVISSIGYETNVFNFTSDELPLQLTVELRVKVKELDNVVVEPFVEETWEKWGRVFTDNFIGNTPNAKLCKLKNEKAIRFRFYKNSNRLVAFSDEPLIIENRALGYNLRYQLEEFEVNFKENFSLFLGFPYFEEIDKNRKEPRRRWKEAREKAYYGSMMHFMRCVYTDSIAANGYEVRRMVRTYNAEKERVKGLYRTIVRNGNLLVRGGVGTAPGTDPDSAAYYEQVMRQKDYTDTYGKDLMTADSFSVKAKEGYRVIYFPDFLHIVYKNELEHNDYLVFYSERRKPSFQNSFIWLPRQEPVTIDVNGMHFPPQELFSMSYWSWTEKMGDTLPSDYQP